MRIKLGRGISVERVSYKDARAKQTKNCRDCFNHFDAPSLERRMRMELMLAADRANALAASTCEAFSARRWSPSARALSRPAIARSVMVWAARSKVCAVFKYSLSRCEIWNVIVPSRGSLAPGLRRFGARAANCGHLPGEL